jgi:hypothetical protein
MTTVASLSAFRNVKRIVGEPERERETEEGKGREGKGWAGTLSEMGTNKQIKLSSY